MDITNDNLDTSDNSAKKPTMLHFCCTATEKAIIGAAASLQGQHTGPWCRQIITAAAHKVMDDHYIEQKEGTITDENNK